MAHVRASLYVGNDPAKTKSQLLYTQVAQVQKLEVCRQVESGESFRKIAKSFGVGLYEEGRQEKVKSRSITNDKKMNIHMPSINV
ncbi:hypothetical protein T4D_10272 [Trichinella pseudospiralis]|uniref:Uncharacterized protein n=1 Tax=Trichinella pseudospiralis TaxID=6337 RepID=A0A0V1F782_TRIPS|nr:hypothetical protein T4D_10272 [Trichinella pseudospiralis]